MAPLRTKTKDNTASIALQFGISLKALRLYEQLGLLQPPRTAAGWRVYGQPEIERLHAILSLKQLGLSLARIAELFKVGSTDLAALLSVQEQILLETQRKTAHALQLVQIAKVRVRKHAKLSADELSALVQSVSKSLVRMTPELEELARRVYTPQQIAAHRARRSDPESMARASEAWARIYADIDTMLPDGDPLSKKGLSIGRRLVALLRESTSGDKALWNSGYRFWKDALSNPRTSAQMPMKQAQWDFAAKVMAELKRRGEVQP
jgi:DNA-binding transcriptional MerR regulator